MPDNGSGVYSVPTGSEAESGEIASSSAFNALLTDLETALSNRLHKDGRTAWTGDQNANSNQITGLATPAASSEAATKGYVDGLTWSTKLKAIADLSWVADRLIYTTGTATAALTTISTFARTVLSGGNAAQWRTDLELGDLAVEDTINNGNWSGADLAVTNGGTGSSTAADARTALGIVVYDVYTGSDVDNITFPIGAYLNVDPGGSTPTRNANVSPVTLKAGNETYELSGGGTTVTGTWRSRGLIGGSLLVQRVA